MRGCGYLYTDTSTIQTHALITHATVPLMVLHVIFTFSYVMFLDLSCQIFFLNDCFICGPRFPSSSAAQYIFHRERFVRHRVVGGVILPQLF